jgi:hypothetical protein
VLEDAKRDLLLDRLSFGPIGRRDSICSSSRLSPGLADAVVVGAVCLGVVDPYALFGGCCSPRILAAAGAQVFKDMG